MSASECFSGETYEMPIAQYVWKKNQIFLNFSVP